MTGPAFVGGFVLGILAGVFSGVWLVGLLRLADWSTADDDGSSPVAPADPHHSRRPTMFRRCRSFTLLLPVLAAAMLPVAAHAADAGPASVAPVVTAAPAPHYTAPTAPVDSVRVDSVAHVVAFTPARSDSMVRAKFYVSKLEQYPGQSSNVGLKPVMPKWDPETRQYEESENKHFWDATPNGDISMSINNGAAAEFFKAHLGRELYIDFSPVDPSPVAATPFREPGVGEVGENPQSA